MPKKDSPQERANIVNKIYIAKHAFGLAARKYGGEVRYVNQHSMIWAGLGSYFSRKSWMGVCSGLSIEWIKSHIMGGDLLERNRSPRPMGQWSRSCVRGEPERVIV